LHRICPKLGRGGTGGGSAAAAIAAAAAANPTPAGSVSSADMFPVILKKTAK